MYFLSAKPLPKNEFLSVYKEAVLLTQLLFAPFGLSDTTVDILGQQNATQLYTAVFQQFEDLVSKRVFSIRGFDDDRIIASMHEFVGENQDQEVVQAMQAATSALQQMLVGPKVVEFDFSQHKGLPASLNVASARTTALLLSKVLTALIPTLYGKHNVFKDGEYHCEQPDTAGADLEHASLFTIDTDTLTKCQVRVPLSSFSPTCSFSRAPFNKVSLRCKDSVNAMLAALTLSVAELSGQSAPSTGGSESVSKNASFTLQQYHSLLDLYGDSDEVKEVIQRFIGSKRADVSISAVRSSVALNSLNLSANPSVSFVNQLTTRLSVLNTAAAAEDSDEVTLGEVEMVTDALELATLSIERRNTAAQSALAEDFAQAAEQLTDGLLDLFDPEESDEEGEKDEEEGEDEDFLLPGHIKVFLWTERATYLLEAGDAEGALRDVNRAISLNNQYAPAYSLRSKLRMQELAQQEQDELEEVQRGSGPAVNSDAEKVEALHLAAEDALLAFLLDGSSDLALAAAAEEAAREACRLSAKNIFRDRKPATSGADSAKTGEEGVSGVGGVGGASGVGGVSGVSALRKDNLPRSWLVGSYFGAYTQLSTALSLYTTTEETETETGGEGSAEAKGGVDEVPAEEESDNLCDIDEDVLEESLPTVPAHLQSAKSAHSAKDKEGYSLLLCLAELMETVTYDGAVNAQSSNVPAEGITSAAPAVETVVIDRVTTVHQRDVTHLSVSTEKKKVVRSVAASLLTFAEKGGLDSLARAMAAVDLEVKVGQVEGRLELVDEGVCGSESSAPASFSAPAPTTTTTTATATTPTTTGAESTTENEEVTEVRVEACRHYRTALSLLRGGGWGPGSADSSVALSAHTRSVVGSWDAETVYALTGVRFNADGSVAEIQSGPQSLVSGDTDKNEEGSVSSTESESEDEDNDYGDSDEDDNAFGNHGGHHGDGYGQGGFSFHFGGDEYGDDEGDSEEESEWETEEEGEEGSGEEGEEGSEGSGEEGEEGSDWETVGSSAEASEAESSADEGEEEEEVTIPKATTTTAASKDKGKTAQRGQTPSFAKALKASLAKKQREQEQTKAEKKATKPTTAKSTGEKKEKNSKSTHGTSRGDEVNAALREIEAQLQRHHLDDTVETAHEDEVEEEVVVKEVGRVEKEEKKVEVEESALPAPPAVAASAGATSIEESVLVEKSDTLLPPSPPVESTVPSGAVVSEDKVAEPVSVMPVAPAVSPVVIDVSYALRARLLNLCGSLAYLAGDAVGAVQCFRASLQFDAALLDSQVKLGSLLVDMDEMKEAAKLLKSAHKKAPGDYITLLHLAEMHTHDNNFDEAVHLLRKARRLAETDIDTSAQSGNTAEAAVAAARAVLFAGADAPSSGVQGATQAHTAEFARRAKQSRTESLANIISLLGINLFRQLPARPEVSLHVLQSALSEQFKDAHCPILLLCCGEVYSQAGDMVTALDCFRKAHALAPNNPLCYVNAARTYQQLNQVGTAERHLQAALLLDPAMAMVRVDLAQNLLLSGHAAQALLILDEALFLARQVSEIRDVLTARTIAAMQVSLEERGLYCSTGARSISN